MRDLRCDSKKFGEVIDDHTVEIKCSSRWCGARRDVVVIHRWDLREGKMETRKYKNPPSNKRS